MSHEYNSLSDLSLVGNPDKIIDALKKCRDDIFERIKTISGNSWEGYASHEKEISCSKTRYFLENTHNGPDNVITILGERGSGKSSLLLSTCGCLLKQTKQYEYLFNENDILLPIIQPESFGADDTLATWVLAHLKKMVESDHL